MAGAIDGDLSFIFSEEENGGACLGRCLHCTGCNVELLGGLMYRPVVWYGVRTLPTGICIACVAADLVVSRTSGIS